MSVKNTIDFKAVERRMRAAIGLYADTAAKKVEGAAKSSAPWTDRTSNARGSIQGNFKWKKDTAVIELSGNVDYFVYLELANSKKHAILSPTMQSYSNEILEGYRRLVT